MRLSRHLGALATAALMAGALGSSIAASASTGVTTKPVYQQTTPITSWQSGAMGGSQWMVKANDYAEFPASYGNWSWMMCGQTVDYGGESNGTETETGPCETGQTPTFANAHDLIVYVDAHPGDGGFVILDPETWTWTPAWEQKDQAKWITDSCVTARAHGYKTIVTPEGPTAQLPAMYKAGAESCNVVEDQTQRNRTLAEFEADAGAFLKIVRAVPDHGTAMLGLATDAGGREMPAATLESLYAWGYGTEHVKDWWLNADAWVPPSGKTAKPGYFDGTGDASVGESFLNGIGGN